MEESLIQGLPLREWIYKNRQKVTLVDLRSILYRVLDVLATLHRRGFLWGYFHADSILIETTEEDRYSPILTGFDYGFSEQITENDSPESQANGFRLYTIPTDLYYYGSVVFETLSSSMTAPLYDAKSKIFQLPAISSRMNSKELQTLLQCLVNDRPEYRTCSSIYLLHPFFCLEHKQEDTDGGIASSQATALFYRRIFSAEHHGKGMLLVELDLTENLIPQTLHHFAAMEPSDLTKPIRFFSMQEDPLRFTDYIQKFLKLSLLSKLPQDQVCLFEPLPDSVEEEPDRQLFLPNPQADPSWFQSFGVFLLKLILDGYSLPQCFPIAFYKILLDVPLLISDLESIDLKRSQQAQFYGGNDSLITDAILKPRRAHFEQLKLGIFRGIGADLKKMRVLDLIRLLHGRCRDDLTAQRLRNHVSFSGFSEERETVRFFWSWLDSLPEADLRLFLFFATGRYHIPLGIRKIPVCGHPHYLIEQPDEPLIFLHAVGKSLHSSPNALRSLHGHVELPECPDFLTLQRAFVKGMQVWMKQENLA